MIVVLFAAFANKSIHTKSLRASRRRRLILPYVTFDSFVGIAENLTAVHSRFDAIGGIKMIWNAVIMRYISFFNLDLKSYLPLLKGL